MLKMRMLVVAVALLTVGRTEYILDDREHGNGGTGVHNLIDGLDNQWDGDGNRIKGEKNAVKGNENKVQGNNNRIQGEGNVVGDISPEELARLQNEMADKLQARFQSIFGGNPFPKAQIPVKANPLPIQTVEKKEEPSQTIPPQPSKIQDVNIAPVVQPKIQSLQPQTTSEVIIANIKEKEVIKAVVKKQREEIQQMILIFRSYGNRKEISDFEDLYDLQNSQTPLSTLICKRFHLCSDPTRPKKRSISFSSIYPPFPSPV